MKNYYVTFRPPGIKDQWVGLAVSAESDADAVARASEDYAAMYGIAAPPPLGVRLW